MSWLIQISKRVLFNRLKQILINFLLFLSLIEIWKRLTILNILRNLYFLITLLLDLSLLSRLYFYYVGGIILFIHRLFALLFNCWRILMFIAFLSLRLCIAIILILRYIWIWIWVFLLVTFVLLYNLNSVTFRFFLFILCRFFILKLNLVNQRF